MDKKNNANDPGVFLLRIGLLVTFLLIILLTLNYFKVISFDQIFQLGSKLGQLNSEDDKEAKVIAKVGAENIYQKELNFEMKSYPAVKDVDIKKLLFEKIVKDSVALQAAQSEGITKLDESVFNSLQIDYLKRAELIKGIKEKIGSKSDMISGAIVSIWFYNRAPGRYGYDKGKEMALAAITKIHDDVKSGKLTIQQAGQAIRNDPKLGYVDPGYLSNALLEFNKSPKEKIVFDQVFDAKVKKMNTDQVSDVYLAKSNEWKGGLPTENMIDSVYMFAQVTGKTKSDISGFDQWIDQKSKSYALIYY